MAIAVTPAEVVERLARISFARLRPSERTRLAAALDAPTLSAAVFDHFLDDLRALDMRDAQDRDELTVAVADLNMIGFWGRLPDDVARKWLASDVGHVRLVHLADLVRRCLGEQGGALGRALQQQGKQIGMRDFHAIATESFGDDALLQGVFETFGKVAAEMRPPSQGNLVALTFVTRALLLAQGPSGIADKDLSALADEIIDVQVADKVRDDLRPVGICMDRLTIQREIHVEAVNRGIAPPDDLYTAAVEDLTPALRSVLGPGVYAYRIRVSDDEAWSVLLKVRAGRGGVDVLNIAHVKAAARDRQVRSVAV